MINEILTKEDIAWMKQNQLEIEVNRQRPVEIEYKNGTPVRNPVTGVYENNSTAKKIVNAITTDRTSRVAAERRLLEQAEVIEGDLWFSINYVELDGIDPKTIINVIHRGDRYAVVAEDPKGIGEYNRHEFVGKKVT